MSEDTSGIVAEAQGRDRWQEFQRNRSLLFAYDEMQENILKFLLKTQQKTHLNYKSSSLPDVHGNIVQVVGDCIRRCGFKFIIVLVYEKCARPLKGGVHTAIHRIHGR